MKRFSSLTLALMISLIVSACGAKPTPTANPIDIQSTVAAQASTMIAQTQAAIPTATPLPPTAPFTDTPAPTNTFLPVPSSAITLTPIPSGNSGGEDPCIHKVLPAILKGEPAKIRIDNSTKVAVSVSVYLNQIAPQGECGYRTYTVDPGQSVVVNNLIVGCYTLWAWNPDPKAYFIVTNGTTCIDSVANSDTWVFSISTRSIDLKT